MHFPQAIRRFFIAAFLLWTGASLAAPPQLSLSFFPELLKSFKVAGVTSVGLAGTICPDDVTPLAGTIPGMRETMKLDFSARRGKLITFIRSEMYYDAWNRLQVPLFRAHLEHEILRVTGGDMYESIDPLTLYHQEIRGGGMVSSFEIWDDLVSIRMKFRYGRCREMSSIGDPMYNLYNRTDSLGYYPTNIGLARFDIGAPDFRIKAGFMILLMEDYAKNTDSSVVAGVPPRRSRIIGSDFNYRLPDDLAELHGKLYLSSYRRDTNDENITSDDKDVGISLSARSRFRDYSFTTRYNYIGADYFTGGNPYLVTDKNGVEVDGTYFRKGVFRLKTGVDYFQDNLDDDIRQPTTRTLSTRLKFHLVKRKLPNAWIGFRFKRQWSDSVVVDAGLADSEVRDNNTRRETSSLYSFSLGGDYSHNNLWFLLWTDFCMARDASHYQHSLPAPANTNQWLLGLRNRINLNRSTRLNNGCNVTLTRQAESEDSLGVDELSLYLHHSTEYTLPKTPLRLEGKLGYLFQQSDLAEREYQVVSLDLRPRYYLGKRLLLQTEYKLQLYLGRVQDYTAHTIGAETQWLF